MPYYIRTDPVVEYKPAHVTLRRYLFFSTITGQKIVDVMAYDQSHYTEIYKSCSELSLQLVKYKIHNFHIWAGIEF